MNGRASFCDPDQVIILAAGQRIQGFADGEFLTVQMMSDGFNDVVGTDGEVARAKSNDMRAIATVKLLQTSLSNDVLSAVHQADLNGINGAGVFVFQVQDLQGTTIIHAGQAWIVKMPDASMDRTPKSREWGIRLASVTTFIGGNF